MNRNASPPPLAVLLAALAMIGPFTIDTYMPSFPAIARDLAVTPAQVQQTLAAYLLPFAFMTLLHGTLSDSFGRRPVILAGLACYVAASVGCALAHSFGQLLLFRALQGLCAGVGMVVGRAIIRDSFEGHEAQRLMALVTMIFGLAPAVAPVIGGWLQSTFDWHAVFAFLALYGAVLLAACWRRLPETLPPASRQPFAAVPLARNYARLGRDPRLVLLAFAIAFNFCGFFLYIASAPAVIYDLLRLGVNDFAWLFVPGIGGVMLGAFLSGRMAGRVSPRGTVAAGYAVMFAAAAFNVGYSLGYAPALPWTVLPVMLYTIGMSLAMPSLTLLALDLFPANRGLASSLLGFAHSFSTGLLAGIVSPRLSHADHALALGMAGFLLAGWALWAAWRRLERRTARPPATS